MLEIAVPIDIHTNYSNHYSYDKIPKKTQKNYQSLDLSKYKNITDTFWLSHGDTKYIIDTESFTLRRL